LANIADEDEITNLNGRQKFVAAFKSYVFLFETSKMLIKPPKYLAISATIFVRERAGVLITSVTIHDKVLD
jgi:hypothetical protein